MRQGEILSLLLFAFYIIDLEGFLKSKNFTSLASLKTISHEITNLMESEIDLNLELLTLFYADDTILITETETGLHEQV